MITPPVAYERLVEIEESLRSVIQAIPYGPTQISASRGGWRFLSSEMETHVPMAAVICGNVRLVETYDMGAAYRAAVDVDVELGVKEKATAGGITRRKELADELKRLWITVFWAINGIVLPLPGKPIIIRPRIGSEVWIAQPAVVAEFAAGVLRVEAFMEFTP